MQEVRDVINQTWLLINKRPATKLLYASKEVCGEGHNYDLWKVLIRTFKEVRLFCCGIMYM